MSKYKIGIGIREGGGGGSLKIPNIQLNKIYLLIYLWTFFMMKND